MTHRSKDQTAWKTANLRVENTPRAQNIARGQEIIAPRWPDSHTLPHSTFPCFFFDKPKAFIKPFVMGMNHTIEIQSKNTVTAKYK